MRKEVLNETKFIQEIVAVFRSGLSRDQLLEKLHDYHENDIAQALTCLDKEERIKLYQLFVSVSDGSRCHFEKHRADQRLCGGFFPIHE